jgi:hypothetical protein
MLLGSVEDSVWGAQEEVIIAKRKRDKKRACFMEGPLKGEKLIIYFVLWEIEGLLLVCHSSFQDYETLYDLTLYNQESPDYT